MTTDPWADHHLVFVAGMHRSGTTTLASVIGAAPGAAALTETGHPMDEGQFLQDTYPTGRVIGGMTGWAMDPRAYAEESVAADVPDLTRRLWEAWSPYWDLSARYLVEKTPLNLTRTRFLQAAFPGSSFVVITRHPVTQALAVSTKSKQRAERYGYRLPRMVEGWVRAHEAFARDQHRLDRVHVVRYEHLVRDPARVVAGLQEFLGFELPLDAVGEWDPARSAAYARRWQAGHGDGVVTATGRALTALPRGRARSRRPVRELVDHALFPRYHDEITRHFGARVAALGYDLEVLDDARPWAGAPTPAAQAGGSQDR